MIVKAIEKLSGDLRPDTDANELGPLLKENKENFSLRQMTNLLQREVDSFTEKSLPAKIIRSKFPELKSLETFDWNFNPGIRRVKI